MWFCFGILYVFTCRLWYRAQVPTDIEKDQGFYIHNPSVPYTDAQCLDDSRMLSYSDVQSLNGHITWTGNVWINASAAYTPWMEYRGFFIINLDIIESDRQISSYENQFTTCIKYCETQWYIGLQTDTCFCLKNNTPTNGYRRKKTDVTTCKQSRNPYTRCANANSYRRMTVYSKDPIKRNDIAFGECLTAKTNGTHIISYMPRYCDAIANTMCIDRTKVLRSGPCNTTFAEIHDYCPQQDVHLPSRKDLISGTQLKDGEFWLSDIRELYFSDYNNTYQTAFPYYCVSGKTVKGRIKLQLTNCTERLPVVCLMPLDRGIPTGNSESHTYGAVSSEIPNSETIESTAVLPNDAGTSESHTYVAVSSEIPNSETMESTAVLPNDDVNLLLIILVSVGAFVMLVITGVVIVVVKKRCRQTTGSDGHMPSVVCATVDKTQNSRPSSNDLVRKTEHNENKSEVNNDPMQENTYDHTNFTLRQSVQQPDVSNYDTMESVQIVGESIYSRSESFRTTGEKTEFVEDDSIYNQTFVVNSKEQSIDDRSSALTDRSSYQ